MSRAELITPARLRELLHYDPSTGVFTWKVRAARRIHVGDVAGSVKGKGYLAIGVGGRLYPAHRLAFLYVRGVWPVNHIDHINGIHDDNKFSNLRDVTRSVNMQNQKKAHACNKLGLLGVRRNGKGFQAQIRLGGRLKCLGTFPTPELAHVAYLKAKREHHPGAQL